MKKRKDQENIKHPIMISGMEMKCLHASMFAWMCHLDLFIAKTFLTIYIIGMDSDLQRLKDCCLIIVGDGGLPDRILAMRRLKEGGRLCHILTEGEDDPRVKVKTFPDEGAFYWHPPDVSFKTSTLGAKLGSSPPRSVAKVGPDAIVLPHDHELVLARIGGSVSQVHVSNGAGEILLQMSGFVVLNPNLQKASELEVQVSDFNLQAFGTFSARGVLLGSAVAFLMLVADNMVELLEGPVKRRGRAAWICAGLVLTVPPVTEMLARGLCGEPVGTWQTYLVLAVAIVVLLSTSSLTNWNLTIFMLNSIGQPVELACLMVFYNFSRHSHPSRHFLSRCQWVNSVATATSGCLICAAAICIIYAWIEDTLKLPTLAALFLPSATTMAEVSLVKLVEVSHRKVVRGKFCDTKSGDQLLFVVPVMLLGVHSLCETTRLLTVFEGAVVHGNFAWALPALMSFLVNLGIRSGWALWFVWRAVKAVCGPTLARSFCPGAMHRLYNQGKVYGGYVRFVPIASTVTSRIATYGLANKEVHPTFNSYAGICLLALLVLELLEDLLILNEVIPVSPTQTSPGIWQVPPGNSNPHQAFAVEFLTANDDKDFLKSCARVLPSEHDTVPSEHPSESSEHETVEIMDIMAWCPAVRVENSAGCFRKKLGQRTLLRPPLALHGLRHPPVYYQVGMVCAMCLVAINSLLPPLFGRGYLLGFNNKKCPLEETVVQVFWQASSYAC